MKVYSISSPEQLQHAADLVKWERDRKKVQEFANKWSWPEKDEERKSMTLEVGRNARLFYIAKDGKKTQLATLYVIPARMFAEEELTKV